MWSISQPKKRAFALQLPPVCKGESFRKDFPGAALGSSFQATQRKPASKNHCKEWIQLFLSAYISHDPDLPQGPAVVKSDMVNLGQCTAQQPPETNTVIWLVICRWSKVSQEAAITISWENEVLVGTAELCASARQRAESFCEHPSGLWPSTAKEQLPWANARSESCG